MLTYLTALSASRTMQRRTQTRTTHSDVEKMARLRPWPIAVGIPWTDKEPCRTLRTADLSFDASGAAFRGMIQQASEGSDHGYCIKP